MVNQITNITNGQIIDQSILQQIVSNVNELANSSIQATSIINGNTKSIFGYSMRFSLKNGTMPLLTTKKVAWKTCFNELVWFIRGSTDNKELNNKIDKYTGLRRMISMFTDFIKSTDMISFIKELVEAENSRIVQEFIQQYSNYTIPKVTISLKNYNLDD